MLLEGNSEGNGDAYGLKIHGIDVDHRKGICTYHCDQMAHVTGDGCIYFLVGRRFDYYSNILGHFQ